MRLDDSPSLPSPYIVAAAPETSASTALVSYAAVAFPGANRALYVPLRLPSTQLVISFAVWCVSTGSGTFDLGLYDSALNRLGSLGSTSLTATSANLWTPSVPIMVEGGVLYFLGLSASTTSASFLSQVPSVLALRAGGYSQQATAHPLPNPAVPAQIASAVLPTFALTFAT